MSSLALLGGAPVRSKPFPPYITIGEAEKKAVSSVMDSGILSRYLGAWHPDFYGGPKVQEFEAAWATSHKAKYAISVNSATSGLIAAVGAAGVGPGDEVIVSPYSMCASATAPLIFNGVPIFADIDPDTYCLSPKSIRQKITSRTKAIIVVHIFGQAANMTEIMKIADEHGIIVIEDAAQAPFATHNGRMVGTLGQMGVFSLNYHKHIHTGEGGLVTTNSDEFAERLQLIRNHAEAVVSAKGVDNLINLIGFNFRLGEIEAAIGLCQLEKAPDLIRERCNNIQYLEEQLKGIPGIIVPTISDQSSHSRYVHILRYDEMATNVSRGRFVDALKAELPVTTLREGEGTLIRAGYTKPLYTLPLFQTQTGYGDVGCPFKCPHYGGSPDYQSASYPNVELAQRTIIIHELMRPPMTKADLDDVAAAFHKVSDHMHELQE